MRKVLNLDKNWKFIVEPEKVLKGKMGHAETYSSVKAGSACGFASKGTNDENWRTVDLPHDRKTEVEMSPDENPRHGCRICEYIWYRKNFEIPEELADKHFTLVFEGISPYSEIFFNGSLMKVCESAYNESVIDISARVHFGGEPNSIAVRIDGSKFELWSYEGAGIYRHVKLYVKEKLHIAHNGLFACPVKDKEGKWRVEVSADVENSAYVDDECIATFKILDKNGNVVGKKEVGTTVNAIHTVTVKTEIPISEPELWDLDNPTLYKVVCSLKKNGVCVDEMSENFGFRTAVFDADKGFILNGKQVKLKGVCCHQDHAGVGVAVPESIQEYRIALLKEMGANAYRCAHNWPAKELLDACDRLGMLVMDENRRFEASETKLIEFENMIRRDRNHPSIIMWSLFNEEELQGSDEGRRIFERLKASVHKLDKSRAVTGALHHGWLEENGTALSMDVTGINYNLAMFDRFHAKFPNQPVLGSENNSSLTIRGEVYDDTENNILKDYDDYATGWGSSMQQAWKVVRERDFVGGLFIWTGFDYCGEPTPFTYPTVASLFGVMDYCGFPKTLYYICKACFKDEPVMHIFPHWNHKPGEIIKVITVTNGDEVELFLNGKSLGRKESEVCSQIIWDVEYAPGELKAVSYKKGEVLAEDIVRTAGAPAKIVAKAHKTAVKNNGMDAVAINVSVVDGEGNPVATADNLIKFEVSGGKVLGCGNGNPNSHEIDALDERLLFNGKCQAIILCEEKAENFTVYIKSKGLESDEISLEVIDTPPYETVKSAGSRNLFVWTKSLKGYAKKPLGNMIIHDTDMNDFVPVNIFRTPWQTLEDGWNLYRAKVEIAREGKALCNLFITEFFYDEYEMWVNDKLVSSEVNPVPHPGTDIPKPHCLDVDFECEAGGFAEITFLIKSNGISRGGIAGNNGKRVAFVVK